MRKLMTTVAAAAVALGFAGAAQAAEKGEGKIQVKLLATGVLPDGAITGTPTGAAAGAVVGSQTTLNNNVVPTLAVEYFFTPNISVETICCFTGHHVSATGALAPLGSIVDHVLVLPATLTAKYHLTGLPLVKPYVGVGPAWFFYIDERPSASLTTATGIDKVQMSNRVGLALQVGLDVPLPNSPFGISFDAKKYFVKTTAHFSVAGTEVLTTEHKVDPWVVSGGVTYRF